jgi:hypothetical protein
MYIQYTSTLSGGRIYLVREEVILVGDQQDGGKKRQISTPVSAFSAIVGVNVLTINLKLFLHHIMAYIMNIVVVTL